MQTTPFNIAQTTSVLQKRWKTLLFFVVASGVIATVTVFVVPRYFRSVAVVVSANPDLADKSRLFDGNLQSLNSYFGNGDDLDRIQGIAGMSSIYQKLVTEFSLVDYYGLTGDSLSLLQAKAARRLKKDIDLLKTEQNQLQIIAWTKDNQLSAKLVNRMVDLIRETAAGIWQNNYRHTIAAFDSSIISLETQYQQLSDSISKMSIAKQTTAMIRLKNIAETLAHFNTKADEFRLGSKALPEILYVLEPASPATYAERPDKPVIIFSACLLALIFGGIMLLLNDRRSID